MIKIVLESNLLYQNILIFKLKFQYLKIFIFMKIINFKKGMLCGLK